MELLNRRREMGKQDDCPYQRIQYLETSLEGGQAWIDTGFIPGNDPFDIFCTFEFLGYSNNDRYISWFGSYDNANTHSRTGITRTENGNSVWVVCGDFTRYLQILANPLKQDIIIRSNGEVRFNNQMYQSLPYEGNLMACDKPFTVFIMEPDVYNGRMGHVLARCYTFRLERDGEKIMDLIPVRIGEEGFMYDRIGKALFGNKGNEGTRFILGRDIN